VRQAIEGFFKAQPFSVAMFAAARVVAVVTLATLLCACTREPPRRSDAEVVVAEVDNTSIVLRDVKNEILSLRGYSPSLEARGASRSEASEALRRLVERTIVLREGNRRGVTVSFSSLEEEVMRYRKDFPPGGLEKALLQVGITPDAWREQLRLSLLYRKSADAIASSLVSVVPQEVEDAFRKEGIQAERPERIRVRQYLFDSASLAAAAREKLLGGGVVDVGGDSAADGVDLGFFSREELPTELPQELFRLKEGEVSEPVPLACTFSLFQVTQREPARAQTLESEEARIRESLLSVRRETALRQWLAQASAKATVKVRAELLEKLVGGKQ
jgi:parvulin-like peptidyl-prolyl isomerase